MGPINDAPLWQDAAIEIFNEINPCLYIVSPSAHLRTEYVQTALKGDSNRFPRQLNWERYYLERASKEGAILAWLPKPTQHNCNRTYARDTRGELGEWRGRLAYDKDIKLTIGGEEGFDGLDVIKRNYLAVCPEIQFYSTLRETCQQAVELTKKSL